MTAWIPHPWITRFRDRIGYGIQLGSRSGAGGPSHQLLPAAQLADGLGFDAVFLGDHPAWAPEPWVHLTAIALSTERIHLGPMVAAAPYRNPLLTARIVSDLDHLSGGRVINGLGIGWNAAEHGLGTNEFDRMGLPYPAARERQAALDEAITIIEGLWGDAPFTFRGEHHSVADANVPPPLQRPAPPLVIAGAGDGTLRQVARHADIANFGPGPTGGIDSAGAARERLDVLRRHCDAIGRDPETVLCSYFTHWLLLAGTERAVAAKVARYFPDGLDAFWGAYLVAGTPAQVAAYYQPFLDVGIRFLDLQVLDPEDDETIRLVIDALAPRLRIRGA
jgi:alkanesulfonate monooxygenase SsuD/methylene tetrahydromethanopterin reductase-like flavin-dependent oxidoreductase (luciferase family)